MKRVSNAIVVVMVMVLSWVSVGAQASSQAAGVSIETQFVVHLKKSFAEKMEIPADSFEVRAENLQFFPAIAPDLLTRVQIQDVMGLGTAGANRVDGLFTLSLSLKYPDSSVREHQISGLLNVVGPVWVSKRVLNRGEVIQSSDLTLVRLPWSQLATGVALTRQDELVGRSLRKLLNVGTPMLGAFLETTPSVKTGDLVEHTVQSGPGVLIRSRAIAKQAGRLGEFIRVEQSDTRKPLQALVTGDKMVEVQL